MKNKPVIITLPNDNNYLPVLFSSVTEVAKLMGYPKEEISKLVLGTEEAASNVIEHAFSSREEATFDVVLQPEALGLRIIIREKGLPFDPSRVPDYDPSKLSDDFSGKGLGLFLMKQFLDEVVFQNLGKGGKETRLFKFLHNQEISRLMDTNELAEAEKDKTEEPLPKGSVVFQVRRLLPEEAVEVSKCAYSSYGYTYINENIYYPDRLREMNLTEQIISFVAVDDSGEIMGHAALIPNDMDPSIAEMGIAFVKPKFRGQGILNHFSDARMEEARRRNLLGLYIKGVTTHPFSQKPAHKNHFDSCALILSQADAIEFKDIKQEIRQRESVIFLYRYLTVPPVVEICPPAHHKDIICKIFSNLGTTVADKGTTGTVLPAEGKSEIVTETTHLMTATIKVSRYGSDVVEEVRKILLGLCLDKIEAVQLYLTLEDPYTALLCGEFEKLNFFFCGVIPASKGKNMLLLQYLNNQVIEYSQLQFASDMSWEIMAYVRDHDPNYRLKHSKLSGS